jgi:hypothetical protein
VERRLVLETFATRKMIHANDYKNRKLGECRSPKPNEPLPRAGGQYPRPKLRRLNMLPPLLRTAFFARLRSNRL